ncbi:hypothetical protein H5410_005112, partial [Solanum commersonii]
MLSNLDIKQSYEDIRHWDVRGHERLYIMNQAIENDNTQSFKMRENASQMTSYFRDDMNATHLNT